MKLYTPVQHYETKVHDGHHDIKFSPQTLSELLQMELKSNTNSKIWIGFEVPIAMTMKGVMSWDAHQVLWWKCNSTSVEPITYICLPPVSCLVHSLILKM
jgi:hypothetical protein